MMRHAIVLSAHNTGLGVIRSLGRCGVPIVAVYYQKSDMGYVSKYVKDRILAPHPEDSESEFIGLLTELARRYSPSILIPADDATLVSTSKNKSQLEEHAVVACPEWDMVRRLIDKKFTYEFAESIGVPAPKTFIPKNDDDAEDQAGRILYPCLVKPCQSHRYFEVFRKKLVQVKDARELMSAYREASQAGMEVMLQEYIPGEDTDGVNYNSYYWENKPLAEFTAEKVRLSPPTSGVPAVVVSKHLPEVIALGRKMLEALGYSGYSCTEFKKDARDGVYKLMEVNPRHNRSTLLAVKCGVNFPLIEYNHLTQDQLPSQPSYKQGVYWIDCVRDFVASRPYRRAGKFSLADFIKPYLRPHTFATISMTDSRPFLKRCIDIAKMAVERVSGSAKSDQPPQPIPAEEIDRDSEDKVRDELPFQQNREMQEVISRQH